MSEEQYSVRNIPSASLRDKDSRQWALNGIRASKNCYHLYFYLLSKSAVDWKHEDKPYYYICDSYWKKKDAAEDIGCDPRTITNNLKTLCENNLLIRLDTKKAYRFSPLDYWAPLHWDIIALFMKLGDDVNWITMLRLYVILGYAQIHHCDSFTINDLITTLGIRNSSGAFLRMTLDWFQAQGFIKFTKKEIQDIRYGTYYRYTLTDIEFGSTPAIKELLKIENGPISNEWRSKILEAAPPDFN